MFFRKVAFAALVLVAANPARSGVQTQSFVVVPSGPGTTVFSSVGSISAPMAEAGPRATASWPVTLDEQLLGTLPATLDINLPGRPLTTFARLRGERRGGNALLWTGQSSDCNAIFSVAPSFKKGTISCSSGQYGIDQTSSGALRLSRYDNAGGGTSFEPAPFVPLSAGATTLGDSKGTTDQTVDILVLFNGSFTTLNIWSTAQFAVDQTQLAMDSSTSPGQPNIAEVRLAGAQRISRTVYNEPSHDLSFLQSDTQIDALRNYWAADVVVYITTGTGPVLGIAYMPQESGLPAPGPAFAPWAYAAVLLDYATNTGDYVFAHEFAHTFGANHNPDHLPANPTPVRSYAFAHWDVETELDRGYITIMSYINECTGHPCERLLHYSNPDVYVDWFHTGLGTRDNARLIKEIAPIQAQYRASVGRIFASGFE
ncbi:M12 family metallo-peptidase [Dokdonella sp.]|uniref:M12 family metallo-peptidase n=1 Tax=Dokdonella sp. TaxID=2291710 RepID=UPI002F41E0CC